MLLVFRPKYTPERYEPQNLAGSTMADVALGRMIFSACKYKEKYVRNINVGVP